MDEVETKVDKGEKGSVKKCNCCERNIRYGELLFSNEGNVLLHFRGKPDNSIGIQSLS